MKDNNDLTGFTPGPWLIDCTDEAINEYKNGMLIKNSNNKNIIAVVTHELENWKEQEKNVLLIQSAPEMYQELQSLRDQLAVKEKLHEDLLNEAFEKGYKTALSEVAELEAKDKEIAELRQDRNDYQEKWSNLQCDILNLKAGTQGYEFTIAELREQLKQRKEECKSKDVIIDKAMNEVSETELYLRDEIKELKEALKEIAEENYDDDSKNRHLRSIIDQIKAKARKLINHDTN